LVGQPADAVAGWAQAPPPERAIAPARNTRCKVDVMAEQVVAAANAAAAPRVSARTSSPHWQVKLAADSRLPLPL